jgi:hypothetical protein
MGRKNRRSNRGMNRRSKRSKRNRRTNMRGGSGSASAALGKISMVIKNIGSESINADIWDNSRSAWQPQVEIPPNGKTDNRDSFDVGSKWRVTGAVNKELSWVLRGEVPQVIDVNFMPSSASVTVRDKEVSDEEVGEWSDKTFPKPTFREHTAHKQNPSSATPWGDYHGDASDTVSNEETDYIRDWKQTKFYRQLFPHTRHVMSHVLFKTGDKDGDYVVFGNSTYGDPENSQPEGYYHFIRHTPSGKTYNETMRFEVI